MNVTVLGSSGTYPTATNPASSLLVRSASTAIWSDAGPGSFAALGATMNPAELDAIVLSHQHPDHCSDFFAAFHALAFGPGGGRPIPVLSNRAVFDRLEAFLDAGPDHRLFQTFDMVEVAAGSERRIGDLIVTPFEMWHSVPTLGTRYSDGDSSMFFTADTGPGGDWAERIGAVDLLIAEASMQNASPPYEHHLTAAEAGAIAARIEAGRLLLTHIPPHLDTLTSIREAEDTYRRTVMAAVPGATYEV